MTGLIAGMDLLDGTSLGEATYLLTAFIMVVTVAVELLTAIARAEARSRVGEAERIAELCRQLAQQSTPSEAPIESRAS